MWPAFKRYFITAQLIVGIANGLRGILYAVRDPDMGWLWTPVMFGFGFIIVAPLVALLVAAKLGIDRLQARRRPRPLDRPKWPTAE